MKSSVCGHSSLAVDNSKLDSNLQTLPVHCSLLDIVTDLLRGLGDQPTKK